VSKGHWCISARPWRRLAGAGTAVLVLGSVAFAASAAGATVNGPGPSSQSAKAGSVQGTLNAVSCTAPTSCTAVGSYVRSGNTLTLAEAWNGSNWTIQPTPNPAGGTDNVLFGVSCGSSGACLAIGSQGNAAALAEFWNGTSWAMENVPLPAGALGGFLVSVSCSSASECMAVGDYADSSNTNVALAESWSGGAFTVQSVPAPIGATTNVLEAVGCSPSPSADCEAVGWNYVSGDSEVAMTLAEGWNGTSWTIQGTPRPIDSSGGSYPTGMSCASPTACTSVGEAFNGSGEAAGAWAQRWNGDSWSNQKVPLPEGGLFSIPSAVSCRSTVTCTLVGYYSNGSAFVSLAEGWNGTKWSVETTPQPSGSTASSFGGVSCTPPRTCTAVGDETNSSGIPVTLAERWNGTNWTLQRTPRP